MTCDKGFFESAAGSRHVELPAGGHASVEIPFLFRQRGRWRGQKVELTIAAGGVVTEVGTSAAKAGVRVGDRVVRVNGFNILALDPPLNRLLITDGQVGESIESIPVTVQRGNTEIDVELPIVPRAPRGD